jgi:hypothetical protein
MTDPGSAAGRPHFCDWPRPAGGGALLTGSGTPTVSPVLGETEKQLRLEILGTTSDDEEV